MTNNTTKVPKEKNRSPVVALCGGVGGAKLALGLYRVLAPNNLTLVINTGDDFEHLGLFISPDIDTVTYTLADKNNLETGWGHRDETWNFMSAISTLKGETWFALGDRDLAIHVERSRRLRSSELLSKITGDIAGNFGIDAQLLPMTNDPAATIILTSAGHLNFQDYFVRMKCKPVIKQVVYDEASVATPNPDVLTALNQAELRAIILCPSNPFLSMDPILAVPGIREAMVTSPAPVIGVSPIINDQAIKGPTSKIMSELSLPSSVQAIAEHYGDLLDGFVIDTADQDQSNGINTSVMSSNILMNSLKDRENLALEVLAFADAITTKEN